MSLKWEQSWELRKLKAARRRMIKTRLYWVKNMNVKMEDAALAWIEDLDKEIADLEARYNS